MHAKISHFFDLVNEGTNETVISLCSFLDASDTKFFTHPLGFVQAKFIEDTTEFRLNIWGSRLSRRKEPDWPVHTHRFDFESKVVAGQLCDTRLELEDKVDGSLFVHTVIYEGARSFLQPLDNCGRIVTRTIESVYSAGDRYSMGSAEFHYSVPITQLCVSLMKIGRSSISPALVIGDRVFERDLPEYYPEELPSEIILMELRNGIVDGCFSL